MIPVIGLIASIFEHCIYLYIRNEMTEQAKKIIGVNGPLLAELKPFSFSHGYEPTRFDLQKMDRDGVRKEVATSLLAQEKELLKLIPEENFASPEKLRKSLTDLLSQKWNGMTYEALIEKFDWSNGRPKEAVSPGLYAMAKLIAQVDAWEVLPKKFPFQEVWRFYIDEEHEQYGAYYYENEPFYMLSSLRGLKEILSWKEDFTLESYENYAQALISNPPILKGTHILGWSDALIERNLLTRGPFLQAQMQKSMQSYSIVGLKHDAIGISDLENRSSLLTAASAEIEDNDESYWNLNATGFTFCNQMVYAETRTTHHLILMRIVEGRKQMLAVAKTPGERLMAYIWAARELEITHQLKDANGRTAITILVKWIAEDDDLSPYIPEDPNILDCQSPEAIVRNVYSGMRRF